MKVGDLVVLSRSAERWNNFTHLKGQAGLVTGVAWFGDSFSVLWSNGQKYIGMDRTDLNHVRKK